MITEKNFPAALKSMGFSNNGNISTKIYDNGVVMQADFNTNRFIYPDNLRGRDRHDNFGDSFKENFVVFECINRLLDKGYRPEDIEIEKRWQLGHIPKSGRADICVTDREGRMLVIIECKTYGDEFKRELNNMKHDGGQLFSYWQQERTCKWLILYASTFDGDKISCDIKSVNCGGELYKDAGNVTELFDIWSTVYVKKFYGDVIFNDDTAAYQIGVKPKLKRDLEDFSSATGIVNAFEEILRHNNVSDKENAFNRLVALFICKIYDEDSKSDNNPVDFCFRTGEKYETFQDRLQSMYHEGMAEFMHEDITYIGNDYLDKLLKNYIDADRAKFLGDLQDAWYKLKFYTNNDFAFVDVHNEQLFKNNAKILIEVVDLFKDYRIIGSNDLQTLGDLFEQLLDKGFKQNEGQFFTPMPITRFIWDSLPLDEFIFKGDKAVLPKIIDYACGAGHFLTEGFEAVNDCFSRHKKIPPTFWEVDKIFGVEKDYRLARVSKISLFMHGVRKGTVKFGDGLENYPDEKIAPHSFDILVSNPPYAISAFKQHLKLNNKFHTLDKISKDGSEIETLFVERIAQLLKSNGIAAVILPSSILNKDGKSFIAARESLLKNFNIRAIVQLGSKTFSATGTNTVIVFLQKFDEPPNYSELAIDTATAILKNYDLSKWKDSEIFPLYVKKIGVSVDDYRQFTTRAVDCDKWIVPYFAAYFAAFKNTAEYKSKRSTATQLNQMFHEYVCKIESEKIRYFTLTYEQTTLVITAPTDNNEQERFLGYSWSNRKGAEGIQYKKDGGLLCNRDNRIDTGKLSCAVRKFFGGERVDIPNAEKYYSYMNLSDMIDFGGTDFTKTIKLTKQRNIEVKEGMRLYKLNSSDFDISIGNRVLSTEIVDDGEIPVYSANVFEEFGRINKLNRDDFSKPSIIWGIDGDWMVNLIPANYPFYPTDHCGVLRVNTDAVMAEYLAFVLRVEGEFERFSRVNRASTKRIGNLTVQIPSIDVQRQIVDEFNAIDNEIAAQDDIIQNCDADVKAKFDELFGNVREEITIGECCDIQKGTTLTRGQAVKGDVPVVAGGVTPSCYHNVANRPANVITISASGSAGYVNLWRVPIFATDCNTLQCKANFLIEYVYHALKNQQDAIYKLQKGAVLPHVYGKDIAKIQIPNPPMSMQEEFATFAQECDAKKDVARRRRDELLQARELLVEKYFR